MSVPDGPIPPSATLYVPGTPESERRASRRAPLCPDGVNRALSLGRAEEPDPGGRWAAGDVMWTCPTDGVIYVPPVLGGVLAEVLFPSEWSLLPPG